jgi:hypothetical protein
LRTISTRSAWLPPIVSSGNAIALRMPYQLVHGVGRGAGRGSGRGSGRRPPPGRPPPPLFGALLEPLPPEPMDACAEEGSKFAARRSETAGTVTPVRPIFLRNSRRGSVSERTVPPSVPASRSVRSPIDRSLLTTSRAARCCLVLCNADAMQHQR